jgi:linoleoyl-CoA desaturase
MCGHFPEGVATFSKTSIEGETRGEWYVRQMVGSANISGSNAMHIMTGNLSFQIEHHLYPDMPSTRYKEISPRIQDLFARYDLPYVTGPLPKQVASAWRKVFRLALPNNAFGRFNRAPQWVREPAGAQPGAAPTGADAAQAGAAPTGADAAQAA